MPCVRKARIIADLPSSIQYWKSRFFFMFEDEWETPSNEFWGEVPRLICRWRALSLGAPSFRKSFFLLLFPWFVTNLFICCVSAVKKCPKLKSRYKERINVATKDAKSIDDFDDLVNPRTLARHCFGPEPSSFNSHAIEIKEKIKCLFGLSKFLFFFFFFNNKCFSFAKITTKFNQEMYAKMKAKKNEPLSNLRKIVVRVVEKGTPITPVASIPKATRVASPATSVEEITPHPKRQCVADKGKEKADSRLSSV